MQSMNARLSGNTKISSQVKFADDRKVPPAQVGIPLVPHSCPSCSMQDPVSSHTDYDRLRQVVNKFLQKIPGRPQVTGPPAQRDFAISSAIFGVLAGITLIQVQPCALPESAEWLRSTFKLIVVHLQCHLLASCVS